MRKWSILFQEFRQSLSTSSIECLSRHVSRIYFHYSERFYCACEDICEDMIHRRQLIKLSWIFSSHRTIFRYRILSVRSYKFQISLGCWNARSLTPGSNFVCEEEEGVRGVDRTSRNGPGQSSSSIFRRGNRVVVAALDNWAVE